MKYSFEGSVAILERTPAVLRSTLSDLPFNWLHQNEGENTWSPYQVLAHLIDLEGKDWIPRVQVILGNDPDKTFQPVERDAHLQQGADRPIEELLDTFRSIREKNLSELKGLGLTTVDFTKKAVHPAFGEVTLTQLLATWTAHDLSHLVQIFRTMARQYKDEIGPWKAYLSVMQSKEIR